MIKGSLEKENGRMIIQEFPSTNKTMYFKKIKEFSTYLQNIEVLCSIVKILAPVGLESNKKHVRCKLPETCQG